MCGRFTLTTPVEMVAEVFDAEAGPRLSPRYNIAPTQDVAAVRTDGGRRQLVLLRWGLVPFWAKDPAIGSRMINARAETVGEKPAFRAALRKRRCLMPADGFYEWRRAGSVKQPMLIRRADRAPFAMAALWERWEKGDGPALESCTIITTEPNEMMRPIHDRMPVILSAASYAEWLDPGVEDHERLVRLLVPCPAGELRADPVSTHVNNPRNDDPRCWEWGQV